MTADQYADLRDLRLRALQDAPNAFGSTYREEEALDNAAWREKAEHWVDSDRSSVWLAWINKRAVGLVACFIDRERPDQGWLASMWVDPDFRRHGIARRLVGEVLSWARAKALTRVHLHVTSNNKIAQRFYVSIGFGLTGESMPHPRIDTLTEDEMCIGLNPSPVAEG